MRHLILIAAAALAAGAPSCAPSGAPPVKENAPAMTESVPAPTPEEAAVRIGADQAGQVVSVPVGRPFAIELVGVPTAGYVWAPVALPSFVTRVSETSGPTTQAQSQPGFTGGNHWEVIVLKANEPGMGDIRMEQRRPWETDEPPTATFIVTIDAR